MRLQPTDIAPDFTVTDTDSRTHHLAAYQGQPVMVSFYRYAACPLCNLRVSQLIRHHQPLLLKCMVMLAFFTSPPGSIHSFVGSQGVPFPVISDEAKSYYDLYRVEEDPDLKAKLARLEHIFKQAAESGFESNGPVEGSLYTLPADFLIQPDGTIYAAHYGADISHHIPLTQVQQFLSAFAVI